MLVGAAAFVRPAARAGSRRTLAAQPITMRTRSSLAASAGHSRSAHVLGRPSGRRGPSLLAALRVTSVLDVGGSGGVLSRGFASGAGGEFSADQVVSAIGEATTQSSLTELDPSASLIMTGSESNATIDTGTTIVGLADPSTSNLGWGPLDMCTFALDQLHNVAGLPWWGSIVALTCAFRVVVFPLNITQQRNSLRMKYLTPELGKIQEEMKLRPSQSPEETMMFQKRIGALQTKHGVNLFGTFLGPLAQIPIFLSMFWTLRAMAEDYPSLAQGGALWFKDLSVPDTTYALPGLCAVSFLAMTELGLRESPTAADPAKAEMMKNVMRGMGLVMLPITATMPSAVAVYWCTTNLFGIVQSGVLKVPGVKESLGIKLLIDPKEYGDDGVAQDTLKDQPLFRNNPNPTKKGNNANLANSRKGRRARRRGT